MADHVLQCGYSSRKAKDAAWPVMQAAGLECRR